MAYKAEDFQLPVGKKSEKSDREFKSELGKLDDLWHEFLTLKGECIILRESAENKAQQCEIIKEELNKDNIDSDKKKSLEEELDNLEKKLARIINEFKPLKIATRKSAEMLGKITTDPRYHTEKFDWLNKD